MYLTARKPDTSWSGLLDHGVSLFSSIHLPVVVYPMHSAGLALDRHLHEEVSSSGSTRDTSEISGAFALHEAGRAREASAKIFSSMKTTHRASECCVHEHVSRDMGRVFPL